MQIEDYHLHPAVSKSHLDAISQSPLHYWSKFVDPNRKPPTPTPAMEFGSAVHAAVLEPNLFATQYEQAPDLPKTTKAGKEAWAAAARPGIKLIKTDEWFQIGAIKRSVLDHPAAHKVLTAPGRAEQSIFAVCPETGLGIKCRPDYLTDSGWLIDLKTTQDASLNGFQRSIANFRYHVQAAHYMNVVELALGQRPRGFIFVSVEKTYPFAVQVFKCSETLINQGAIDSMRDLRLLKESIDKFSSSEPWPSYSINLVEIDLPSWAMNRSYQSLETF